MEESFSFLVTLMIVLAVISGVFLILFLLKMYIRRAKFTKDVRIDGKVVIITGANTGIGKETAIDLAKRGGKIYMACRDISRGEAALQEVRELSGSKNIFYLQLDLASMESIRSFSQKYHETENRLDILMNNAGVMACPKSLTTDGFEMQIGVNHLGHFLLTNLLLDLIKVSAPSRIVVVSSMGHTYTDINKEDFNSEKSYAKIKAYSQSKLANVLFARELSKRLINTGVTVNSLHPGVVNTELGRYMVSPFVRDYIMKPLLTPFFKTPIEGAQTQIRLAVDPELECVTGKYFSDFKEKEPSAAAQNDSTATWLWNKSEEMTKLKKI